MGLFDKKTCDICGNKIGLFGNRKLEDGNLCKDCAAKLSPYFTERRASTVTEIAQQLQYRAANEAALQAFKVTKTLNGNYKILVDEDAQCFVIAKNSSWRDNNPDIIPFAELTGCTYEIKETKRKIEQEEEKDESEMTEEEREAKHQRELEEAREEARREGYYEAQRDQYERDRRYGDYRGRSRLDEQYERERELRERERELDERERALRREENPEYEYSYDFNMKIFVDNPYFDEIPLKMNGTTIKDKESSEYKQVLEQCEEIKNALLAYRASVRGDIADDLETLTAAIGAVVSGNMKQCAFCGETVEPEDGKCPNCGAEF